MHATDPRAQAVPPPGTLAAPGDGHVHVWWATVEDVTPTLLESLRADLDEETVARTNAMVREDDRRRTIVAHGLLRRLVAAITGTAPADVAIQRICANCGAADHGKPALAVPPGAGRPPLQFNLAHSGNVVAVALASASTDVGIDVEAIRSDFDWQPARRHVFTDAEWARSETHADPVGERFALWARKEAAAKTTGHGLAIDLVHAQIDEPTAAAANELDTQLGHGAPDGALRGRLTAPEQVYDLVITDITVGHGAAGAVAIRAEAGGPPTVNVRRADLTR